MHKRTAGQVCIHTEKPLEFQTTASLPLLSASPLHIPTCRLSIYIITCLVSLGKSSGASLRRNGHSLQRNLETQRVNQLGGLSVNLQLAVGVGKVQGRNLGDVLVLSLTLLLLQLEGNTSHGTLLDSLHQVSGVTSNLVSESLGLDLGDLRSQSLVGLEVQGQLGVVSLDQNLGGSLDGFSSNATLELVYDAFLVGQGRQRFGFVASGLSCVL